MARRSHRATGWLPSSISSPSAGPDGGGLRSGRPCHPCGPPSSSARSCRPGSCRRPSRSLCPPCLEASGRVRDLGRALLRHALVLERLVLLLVLYVGSLVGHGSAPFVDALVVPRPAHGHAGGRSRAPHTPGQRHERTYRSASFARHERSIGQPQWWSARRSPSDKTGGPGRALALRCSGRRDGFAVGRVRSRCGSRAGRILGVAGGRG